MEEVTVTLAATETAGATQEAGTSVARLAAEETAAVAGTATLTADVVAGPEVLGTVAGIAAPRLVVPETAVAGATGVPMEAVLAAGLATLVGTAMLAETVVLGTPGAAMLATRPEVLQETATAGAEGMPMEAA
ncbi:hypothetical protein ACETIH_23835 [Microvirga arabica]|uniref:Uncharacterized protein n=1 Tax=Microvirga arabica TaxID=1128671 RepID=A0ABV6YEF4_9HYPH